MFLETVLRHILDYRCQKKWTLAVGNVLMLSLPLNVSLVIFWIILLIPPFVTYVTIYLEDSSVNIILTTLILMTKLLRSILGEVLIEVFFLQNFQPCQKYASLKSFMECLFLKTCVSFGPQSQSWWSLILTTMTWIWWRIVQLRLLLMTSLLNALDLRANDIVLW